MAEYIDREAAIEVCKKEYQERLRMLDYCGDTVAWNIGGAIKALPAADVAPVVRCKDCVFSHLDGWFCGGIGIMPEHQTLPDDFCSYGLKMDRGDLDGQRAD